MTTSGHGDTALPGRCIAAGTLSQRTDSITAGAAWRLSLHQLTAGQPLVLPTTMLPSQIAALDAAAVIRNALGEHPLPRMRTHAVDGVSTIIPAENTRVACLQHDDSLQAELIARPLHGPMLLTARGNAHWLLWLLAGQAHWQCAGQREALELDRPLWLAAGREPRLRIDGGGEVILVRVSSRTDTSNPLDPPT